MLETCGRPLAEHHDLVMLDLDGVVYIGADPVRGAPEHLAAARDLGAHLAFITNNASRAPAAVAAHLEGLRIPAATTEVVTSAQAAAHLLAAGHDRGAAIALLGGDGLREALVEEGLVPVPVDAVEAVAVVSGYGPDVPWRDVVRAGARIRDGLRWVASNRDLTFPTAAGLGPGHGALVRMLEEFSGVTPDVAGKPSRHLLDETIRRVGGERPLMVGDRIDTDIEGAHATGIDSLLVLTGVSGLADLVSAAPHQRPTYLAADLGGLTTPHRAPTLSGDFATLADWRARVVRGRLEVTGSGDADDWWRVAATAAWAWQDRYGEVPSLDGCVAPVHRPADGAR